jgi:hypothetical protein
MDVWGGQKFFQRKRGVKDDGIFCALAFEMTPDGEESFAQNAI